MGADAPNDRSLEENRVLSMMHMTPDLVRPDIMHGILVIHRQFYDDQMIC
jgi:hypothetical protein